MNNFMEQVKENGKINIWDNLELEICAGGER